MAQRFADEGRSSDAEALIRLALDQAPDDPDAHVLLARLRTQRGEPKLGVDALVEAARALAPDAADAPGGVFAMLGVALELDPSRLELHVDLAELQAASGDIHGARARLVQLSMVFLDEGQPEDARAVLAVASGWDPQSSIAGVIQAVAPLEESIPILLEEVEEQARVIPPSTHTICTPTLLRDASGQLLPNQERVPAPPRDPGSRRPTPEAPIPAPPVHGSMRRPKTGRARTVPASRSSIRALRARATVRANDPAPAGMSLARRLRKLGGLPSKD